MHCLQVTVLALSARELENYRFEGGVVDGLLSLCASHPADALEKQKDVTRGALVVLSNGNGMESTVVPPGSPPLPPGMAPLFPPEKRS